MLIPRTRRGLAQLLLAGIAVLAFQVPAATAMPPAHGLTAAQERAADAVLEDAVERGVGDLPASPFLKRTACGTADAAWRTQARRMRVATAALREAQRAGRSTRSAARRVATQRKLLRTAAARRARLCVPSTSSTKVDEDTTLKGTTVSERPRSMVVGTGMVVALPIEFSDVRANRTTHPASAYEDLLFGPANSLNAFYRDMSYGSFSVQGDVQPWRRLDKRRGAYADREGGMGAYPANSQSMLEDAVAAYDGTVDFAKYDNDGPDGKPNSGDDDGFVDSVVLIFAGTSSAESGNLGSIWPHAWRQTVATRDASKNGGTIKVGRYAVVPERMEQRGSRGDLLSLGVVAHEYGHTLGLPDLIDGEDGAGAGTWDLMGSGMWGFKNADRPTGLSAWSRARLGWVTPQLLTGDHLAHRLGSSYAQRSIVKLPVDGAPLNEHFLVERRTQTGFDADAPAGGLLVWHVDDSIAPDDASGHPRVELVAADGTANGDAGDLLTAGGALGDSTDPDTKSHAGRDSLVAIQNVGEVTVDLHAGKASLASVIDASTESAGPQAAAPVATLTAPVDGARVRGTITMSCQASGSPNINRITFYRNSTSALSNVAVTPTAATATRTYNFNTASRPDGPNTLACRARNTSNQWSAYSTADVVIDNTVPGTPTVTMPAVSPAWLRGTVSWDATATDNYGVTTFSYRVDGVDNWQTPWTEATPKSNTFSWDTTTVANGNHTLTVRAQDLAGNLSAVSANRAVRVDNALPVMSVPTDGATLPDIDTQVSNTALNARWTAATDANSGMASYSWRFCTSPACTTVVASGSGAGLTATAGSLSLAVGTYYACVKAIDVAGNQSADSCSDGVMVDNVAPAMSVPMDASVAPDLDYQSSTNTLNAVWTAANDGAGTGVAGYDWRFCPTIACATILGSGSGTGLTATSTGLTLANGTTYFACVRARDQLSNTSAYVCSDGITVDTGVPTMTTPMDGTTAPDKDFQTSTTTLSAVWTAGTDAVSGVASYDWRFCTLPACGTILASGNTATLTATAGSLALTGGTTYYACVRARDNVGLTSAYVCSDGIAVDTGPPTMSTPTDGNPAPDVDFQTSATTLNAVWTAATDGGSGVASYDWRFCAGATTCGTIVASGSGAGLSGAAGSLTLVDGTTYFACVRAVDSAGNQSAYVCSDGVVADLAAPTMSTPNDGVAADIDAQLSTSTLDANWTAASDGAGSGVASYAWRFCTTPACGTVIASGSGAATTASATGLTLSDGVTYYACVNATDQVGRTSADSCSDGVVIDNVPVVNITNPANNAGVTGTIGVAATATDAGGIDKVEFYLDGALQFTQNPGPLTTPLNSTWTWNTTPVSTGSHTIEARAYDGGGQTGSHTITVIVDRTNPTTSHAGIAPGATVFGTINLMSSSSDAGGIDRVEYRIDNVTRVTKPAGGATTFNDPGTPFNTATLLDGNHAYRVQTFDLAGNSTFSSSPTQFVVNNNYEGVAPTATISSPSNGVTLTTPTHALSATVQDVGGAIVKIEWIADGSPIPGLVIPPPPAGTTSITVSDTWSTSGLTVGAHTVGVRVTDASGNQADITVNVTR